MGIITLLQYPDLTLHCHFVVKGSRYCWFLLLVSEIYYLISIQFLPFLPPTMFISPL